MDPNILKDNESTAKTKTFQQQGIIIYSTGILYVLYEY